MILDDMDVPCDPWDVLRQFCRFSRDIHIVLLYTYILSVYLDGCMYICMRACPHVYFGAHIHECNVT
jgi:hypothetical protein